jgi:hypothetical protein
VIDKIQSSNQELLYPTFQQMMSNYARAQERIGREIDTMDLRELNKYLGHTKPLVMGMIIENAREELKKEMQAQEGPVEIHIKYSDTDQTIQREALKLQQEWGHDEPPKNIIN